MGGGLSTGCVVGVAVAFSSLFIVILVLEIFLRVEQMVLHGHPRCPSRALQQELSGANALLRKHRDTGTHNRNLPAIKLTSLTKKILVFQLQIFPQTGLPVRGSYFFERGANN